MAYVTGIPVFAEIDELHLAASSQVRTRLPLVHVYRNEAIEATCRPVMPAHRCGFHQLCFDRTADYQLTYHDVGHRMRDNLLYFTGLGKVLSWRSAGGPWRGYSILFRPELLEASPGNGQLLRDFPFLRASCTAILPVGAENERFLTDVCEQLLAEYERPGWHTEAILRHLLLGLLYFARRLYEQHAGSGYPVNAGAGRAGEVAAAFEALAQRLPGPRLPVAAYADRLCVSAGYLAECVKQVLGVSPKDYLLGQLTQEARNLLFHTTASVAQVARQLAFRDGAQFSRFFKAQTGLAPGEYRRQPAFCQ